MRSTILLSGLIAAINTATAEVVPRDICNPCKPDGASGKLPAVGSDLKSLYADLLDSVKDIKFQQKRTGEIERKEDAFCCRESLDCVKVKNFNVPTCYDKFTTNFAFPDGSFGSLTTGNYTQGGSQVNLLTGQFRTEKGETGDIYAQDPAAKPNTATLSIPPQWTAAGEGSAIPATEIGSVVPISSGAPNAAASASATPTDPAAASNAAATNSNGSPAPTSSRESAALRIAIQPRHAVLLAMFAGVISTM